MADVAENKLASLIADYVIRHGDYWEGRDALLTVIRHWAVTVNEAYARAFQYAWDKVHYHTQYELDKKIKRILSPTDLRNSIFFGSIGCVLEGFNNYDSSLKTPELTSSASDVQLKRMLKDAAIEEMFAALRLAVPIWIRYLMMTQKEALEAEAAEIGEKQPFDVASYVYLHFVTVLEDDGFQSEKDIEYWKKVDISDR